MMVHFVCSITVEGTDEKRIRAALKRYGKIESVKIDAAAFPPAIVRFATHEQARILSVGEEGRRVLPVASTHNTMSDRTMVEMRSGRDDDDGRGW